MKTRIFIGGFMAGTAVGIGLGFLLTSLSADTKDKLMEGAKKLASSLKATAIDSVNEMSDKYAKMDAPAGD